MRLSWLENGFIDPPLLAGILTESHFNPSFGRGYVNGRIGRTLDFMARLETGSAPDPLVTPKVIAMDESTALEVQKNGQARVVGPGAAYFMSHPSGGFRSCVPNCTL